MNREQMIEQRAMANYELWRWRPEQSDWPELPERGTRIAFRRIARAEIEREARLVDALKEVHHFGERSADKARRVIVEYEAEFAPPVRTVEQIARDVVALPALAGGDAFVMVRAELLDELAAALGKGGA